MGAMRPWGRCGRSLRVRERVPDVDRKLRILLKALNLSRGSASRQLGIDPSLLGRWLNGGVHPSAQNLALLTTLAKRGFPEFNALLWEGELRAFVRALGLAEIGQGEEASSSSPDTGGEPLPRSLEASRREIAREGDAY